MYVYRLKKLLDITLYVSFPYYEVTYLDILTPSLSFPRYGLNYFDIAVSFF